MIIHGVLVSYMGAFFSSWGLFLLGLPFFLAIGKKYWASPIRPSVPDRHKIKHGIPTLGGIWILFVVWGNPWVWMYGLSKSCINLAYLMLGFAAIGAIDDWSKIRGNGGISALCKWCLQVGCVSLFMWCIIRAASEVPYADIWILFYGFVYIGSMWGILWVFFILLGVSNAVNITDGLDGLATMCLIPNFFVQSIFALDQLRICEAIVGMSICGALIGFYAVNRYPARMFMGDCGALSLGAALGYLALATNTTFLLAVSGIIFVIEVLSVALQITSKCIRKKRIFKLAPIHHHFELMGYQEYLITRMATIISWVAALSAWLLYTLLTQK